MTIRQKEIHDKYRSQFTRRLIKGVAYLSAHAKQLDYVQLDDLYRRTSQACSDFIQEHHLDMANPMSTTNIACAIDLNGYLSSVGRKNDLWKYINKNVRKIVKGHPLTLFWYSGMVIDPRNANNIRFHIMTVIDFRKALWHAVRCFRPKQISHHTYH